MFEIRMIGEDYEQDIRPLVKAFFPEEEIVIATSSKEENTTADYRLELRLSSEWFFFEIFSERKRVYSTRKFFGQRK